MAAPRGRVRYCPPGPGSACPLVEMESGHHKSALLYCLVLLLLSSRMALLDLVAFRLGVINPLLCVPLSQGGVSGSRIVVCEKHGSLLPNPVSTCVSVCVCVHCGIMLHVPVPVCSCLWDIGGTLDQQGCVMN